MRTFCTEGPIDKKTNYYVPRTRLLEEGLKKVDERRYFTIFAPRQSGKTTYFQFLIDEIREKRKDILPLWISFEGYSDKQANDFLNSFTRDINISLAINEHDLFMEVPETIENIKDRIIELKQKSQKEIVLIIDEIEGLKNPEILNQFMHTIRSIYHRREWIGLTSVILTGVSNITGIIQDSASPFNVADQINVPYFTEEEVKDLLGQHEQETGQLFEEEVKEGIYENTKGQPGLVGALARDLVEKKCPNGERITYEKLLESIDDFTTYYIDKNIANIVNKAKQEPEIMKKILFKQGQAFKITDDRINTLYVNGVIEKDEDGNCIVDVPIYNKALYHHFKPSVNGEKKHFTDPFQRIEAFQEENGKLKMEEIIQNYRAYIKRRGNIIFNNPNEGEYQYNIDAYLHAICEFLGAKVYPEVVEGGGRVDLLIIKGDWKWIIETKVFTNISYLEKAKRQLLEYLKRSEQKEGWLIVFSQHHKEFERQTQVEGNQTIHTHILPIMTQTPSGVK